MPSVATQAEQEQLREFAIEAARLLSDRHCEDVRLLDVRGVSHVCDFILLGNGTSDRQMKSVGAELEELGKSMNNPAFRSNRDEAATWIIIDFVDLVVHLFEPGMREFYDLDGLWSDAPPIDWAPSTA